MMDDQCPTTSTPPTNRREGNTLGKQTNRHMKAKREAEAKAKANKRHQAERDERQGRKEHRDKNR
jgi:hypothetical protein